MKNFTISIFLIPYLYCCSSFGLVQEQEKNVEKLDLKKFSKEILDGKFVGASKEEKESILDYHYLAENIWEGKDVKKSTELLKEKLLERSPAILGGFFDTPEMIRARFEFYLEDLEYKKIVLNKDQQRLLINILSFCDENIKEYEKRFGIAYQRERGVLVFNEDDIEKVVERNLKKLSPSATKIWDGYLRRKQDFRPASLSVFVYGGRKNLGFRTIRGAKHFIQKTRTGNLTKMDLAMVEGMLRLMRHDMEVLWLDDVSIQTTLQEITPPTEFDHLSRENCLGILRPLELLYQKTLPSPMNLGIVQNESKNEINRRKAKNPNGRKIWGVPILLTDKSAAKKDKKPLSENPHRGGISWGHGDRLAEKEKEEQLNSGPYQWQKFNPKNSDVKTFKTKIEWLKKGPDTKRFDLAIEFTAKLLGKNSNFPWPENLQKSVFHKLKRPKYINPFEKLHSSRK